ncbi:hypothetical protein CSUI_007614 [Cystoisospora suis]|uniref:Uncharacterized protein n=1 Tax=Cystoisospora suis TaxID=483139 RepID=A0A2C6KM07_9APIC|nr:hypothetical protein CSUI_007614 [Cystoisospora suis]
MTVFLYILSSHFYTFLLQPSIAPSLSRPYLAASLDREVQKRAR